jgi:hypothetical protein
MIGVLLVKAICWLWYFEKFSESFIKPERDSRQYSMKISMCRFVPKVFGNSSLPWGKDSKRCVGLNETGPATWKSREVPLHKILIVGGIIKKIEMYWLIGNRYIEFLTDSYSHGIKFTNQTMLTSEWEIRMDS